MLASYNPSQLAVESLKQAVESLKQAVVEFQSPKRPVVVASKRWEAQLELESP